MKISKGIKPRIEALYHGIPAHNVRTVLKKLKEQGITGHAVKNKFGTYDVYKVKKFMFMQKQEQAHADELEKAKQIINKVEEEEREESYQ